MRILKELVWLRLVAMLLIGFGILQLPIPTSENTPAKMLIEIAIGVVAVAVIPIVAKAWPIPGERPISMKRWAFILVMMFVGGVVIKFQDVWFPNDPSIGRWLVAGLFALTGIAIVFLQPKRAEQT